MGFAFEPGRNCWRVNTAARLALIVDGADYFAALRESLIQARRSAVLVGWDFDFDIEMLPGQSNTDGIAPDGYPNRIGAFLERLVDERPGLDIYLLKWSGGAVLAPSALTSTLRLKLFSSDQIHLAMDGRHPIGACHHQKIVVIDDSLAFCGGIDATAGRWDDRRHASGNPLRRDQNGTPQPPWHDTTTVMDGPAAAALGLLARARWRRAHHSPLPEDFRPGDDRWPASVTPDFTMMPVAIARTQPPERDHPIVAEIERLYLDAIAAARHSIYIESQYLTATSIVRALARRLAQADGPDIVIINPHEAFDLIEDQAMHSARSLLMADLARADRHHRLRILSPVNDSGENVYVHAKICIVDDWFLQIGSSNIDRRSMGFDTESDVAWQAEGADRDRLRGLRDGLLAEHLGVSPDRVARAVADAGLVGAIDALNDARGRHLRPIAPRRLNPISRALAQSRIFDPRFRRSAGRRLGLSTRHLMLGGAAVAALVWAVRGRRR